MEDKEAIKQAILQRGYSGFDRRWYSKYSLYDIAWAVMGLHPIYNSQVVEGIQQRAGLDDTTAQYGGPLTLEQVEQVAALFAESGFSMRVIARECSICGSPFQQRPDPTTERARYFTCPECRAKSEQANSTALA